MFKYITPLMLNVIIINVLALCYVVYEEIRLRRQRPKKKRKEP